MQQSTIWPWQKGATLALTFLSLATVAVAQEAVVAPNENLVAEGMPAIPKALAERAAPYMEFRAAALAAWHPTRREILIATRFGAVPQLHRVAFPGGARTQLTFYPEPVAQAAYRPAPRGNEEMRKRGNGGKSSEGISSFPHFLISSQRPVPIPPPGFVFSKDLGGNEFYQIFWRPEGSGQAAMITDGKSRNEPGPFSNDARWLAYTSTRRNGQDSDVYLIDPSDPKTNRLVLQVSGGGWGPLDWSPDDRTLLVGEYLSINESRLYLVDVASGSKTLLTPPAGEPVAYGNAVFTKDGKGVILSSDQGSEFVRLMLMDLGTRKLEPLAPAAKGDVSSFALADDGRKLAYVVNEEGSETLHVLDLRTRKELSLPKLPLGVIGGVEFHPNSRDLGFTLSSARSPSDVFSINLESGKLDRWTESETGGLDASTFSEPELVRWKSFDGRTISGFLYRPAARFTGPRPVIVDIHGGPEGQFQPRFLGRYNFYLNELGVALVFPNVRGSAGFGKSFLKLDNGEKREDSVRDIGALLDWIATQPGLDKNRVMVTGGSYGGYMTLASMTHYNNRFRCGVDIVGISNFVTFLERTEAYRRDLRRVEYGDERDPKMREFLTRISPLSNARKITKPMFIVQGRNDPRVPYQEAEQIVAQIKQQGGKVWYLMAKDEGHGFAKKPNADFQFLATIRFVEENLLR